MAKVDFQPVEVGSVVTAEGQDHTVLASCDQNVGSWYCTSCHKAFRNNLEKDTHASSGVHVLAWVCLEHGMEKP